MQDPAGTGPIKCVKCTAGDGCAKCDESLTKARLPHRSVHTPPALCLSWHALLAEPTLTHTRPPHPLPAPQCQKCLPPATDGTFYVYAPALKMCFGPWDVTPLTPKGAEA